MFRLRSIERANIFAISLFCLLFVVQATAQQPQPSPTNDAALAARIDQYVTAQAQANLFSGVVLVARNGQPVFSRAYGMANRELEAMNTLQTKFRIGSLTKQFTAAAILLLQERGRLSVQDSVCRYVPECPAQWQPVTIHHLLTHTSGIPNFTNATDYLATMRTPSPPTRTIERFRNLPLEFAPGSRFNYSNSGYILLGLIIERISGAAYADFMRQNIFAPLNMRDTGYDDSLRVIRNRATGYARDGDEFQNASFIDMTIPHAAGALYATATDLLLWDQALYGTNLLTQNSLNQMFTPARDNYAYGWFVTRRFNRRYTDHGGGINGFSAFIARYPDERVTVIVLSNLETANTGQIANRAAAILFGEALPTERTVASVDPRIYDAYVGRYQLAPTFIITITKENNRLMAQATGQPKFEVFPESETRFFFRVVDAQITFTRDSVTNQVTGLTLHQNGRDVPAQRLSGDASAPSGGIRVASNILDTYVGEYELAPGFAATVTREGERLMTQITGQPRLELIPQSETRFLVGGTDAEVTFARGANGQVTEVVIVQGGQTTRARKTR